MDSNTGQSKKKGPKQWFKSKNNQWPLVKKDKSPSPSKCDESSDGNGEEGMMNMVGHTRNQRYPMLLH